MSSHPTTILIVDDDPALREEMLELVELLGYRALAATSDADALRLLALAPGAVLVVGADAAEPGGCGLIRRVRALAAEGSRAAILAVTASGDEAARERCLGAGADEQLGRPLDRERLVGWLGSHVAAAAILDENMVVTLRRLKLIEGLYPAFILALPEQVKALRAAIAAGDRGKIRQQAHRLRGSAAQMGAAALAQVLQSIEGAAKGPEAWPIVAPGPDFDGLIAATLAALSAEIAGVG